MDKQEQLEYIQDSLNKLKSLIEEEEKSNFKIYL